MGWGGWAGCVCGGVRLQPIVMDISRRLIVVQQEIQVGAGCHILGPYAALHSSNLLHAFVHSASCISPVEGLRMFRTGWGCRGEGGGMHGVPGRGVVGVGVCLGVEIVVAAQRNRHQQAVA
jgi:hypothetical protein